MIFQCLSTVNFTLLLNGTKSASFSPSKSIRQGGPLSPYLFILCSEIMARLINRASDDGSISGVKMALGGLFISKLIYADDVLLFCGAKIAKVEVLMGCVNKFCYWSGLSLNIDKSGMFVSKGVHSQFSWQVKHLWGFKPLAKEVKYLGLPLFLSANKVKDFAFMKEKLESRVSGWKSKCLSWAGHVTLIKSVAQATPVYSMSVFKLPKVLCSNLDAIVRKFWWCPQKDSNKFYTPMAWASLCKPRSQGGLEFRQFERFNEAMLAKLA